jgi:hypothetical protein
VEQGDASSDRPRGEGVPHGEQIKLEASCLGFRRDPSPSDGGRMDAVPSDIFGTSSVLVALGTVCKSPRANRGQSSIAPGLASADVRDAATTREGTCIELPPPSRCSRSWR